MIYAMKAGQKAFKVGYTNRDVEKRRKELSTGCPEDLTIVYTAPGSRKLERIVHKMLTPFKVKKGEDTEYYHIPHIEGYGDASELFATIIDRANKYLEAENVYQGPRQGKKYPDESIRNLHDQLRELAPQLEKYKYIKNLLKKATGDYEEIVGVCSCLSYERESFDLGAFRKDHSQLYHNYLQKSRVDKWVFL